MSRKVLNNAAIALLLLNGACSFFSGWNLVEDPSGKSIGLPVEWLLHNTFDNYMGPGILLFYLNGILSLVITLSLLKSSKNYSIYIIVLGCLLTGWTLIQIIFAPMHSPLQIIFGIIGMLLITTGSLLSKNHQKSNREKSYF